jgi:enterochelin esterase-like enzyme
MKAFLTILWTACMWLALAAPVSAQTPLSPQDEADRLEALRSLYPELPPDFLKDMTTLKATLLKGAGCKLLDWLATSPPGFPDDRVRKARYLTDACLLPIEDLTPTGVAARLRDKVFDFDADPAAGVLTIYAKGEAQMQVCCSVQTDFQRIGTSSFWAQRMRLKDLDRGSLSFFPPGARNGSELIRWRGPNAGRPPPGAKFETQPKGRLVHLEMRSEALNEMRKLNIYLPPGWSKDREWPAVYLTDGAAEVFMHMVDAMIEAGEIRPLLLISAASGGDPLTDGNVRRMAEYYSDGPAFDRHLTFFAEELTAYATREYGASARREDRMVSGFSNGGVFALKAGVRRPDVFALAAPMSPGSSLLALPSDTRAPRASFWISGGLYEPGFHQGAEEAANALKSAGYKVLERYPPAGHFQDQWQEMLRLALIDAFPPE